MSGIQPFICHLSSKKSGKLTAEDGSLFTTTVRALTHRIKHLHFWALKISIWWVICRIVLIWHRTTSFYSRTKKIRRNVNVFRHLKKRLMRSECMFWRYLNQIAKSASTIGSKAFDFNKTYIIGHYKPSVRISDLVSHTTYAVCVNFIHKWRDLQFKVDSERQIFWQAFHGNFYLLSEFLPEICWEEIAKEILFVFRFDVWPGTRTLTFRLISQHTTY